MSVPRLGIFLCPVLLSVTLTHLAIVPKLSQTRMTKTATRSATISCHVMTDGGGLFAVTRPRLAWPRYHISCPHNTLCPHVTYTQSVCFVTQKQKQKPKTWSYKDMTPSSVRLAQTSMPVRVSVVAKQICTLKEFTATVLSKSPVCKRSVFSCLYSKNLSWNELQTQHNWKWKPFKWQCSSPLSSLWNSVTTSYVVWHRHQ